MKDSVELLTEDRFRVQSDAYKLIIDSPGEFEVGDFSIKGIPASRSIDNPNDPKISTIYSIVCGDVSVCILGNIAPDLSEEQLEDIGIVNILILPIGGSGYTLDATSAVKIVKQIDPRVIIPIHYNDSALKYEVPQDARDVFLKELNVGTIDAGSKYKIKSRSSLPESTQVLLLDRSTS